MKFVLNGFQWFCIAVDQVRSIVSEDINVYSRQHTRARMKFFNVPAIAIQDGRKCCSHYGKMEFDIY